MVEHGDVVQRGVDAQRLDVDLLEPALGKRVANGDVLDGEVRGVDQRVAGRGVRAAHFEHRHVGLVARLLPAAFGVFVPVVAGVLHVHRAVVESVVNPSADRIGRQERDVDVLQDRERRTDAAEEFRLAAFVVVFAQGGHRHVVGDVLVAARVHQRPLVVDRLGPVGVVELLARGGVHAGRFRQVEGVDRPPHLDDADARRDDILAAREREHLVAVERTHQRRVPAEVALVEDRSAQRDLEPLVAQRADVVVEARESGRDRQRTVEQHVARFAVVVLDRNAQSAAEHRGFDAGVEVAVLLPGHLPVFELVDEGARIGGVGPRVVVETLPCVIGSQVVVALYAV